MKDFIKKLIDSLDTNKSGFSGRKLTAFAIVMCVIATHIKWLSLGDFNQMNEVFIVDYTFIAALFGMTTYQNIKGKDENSKIPNN